MNRNFVACFLLLLLYKPAFGQETPFEWLLKFQGNWESASLAEGQDEKEAIHGKMASTALGSNWVVNHFDAEMGGMRFQAVQTLGYDEDKKAFVGSWVDSMEKFVWEYDGEIVAEDNKLVLNAEGPDFADPTKMRQYRDVYIFGEGTIESESQLLSDAGEWETFMSASMKRAQPEGKPAAAAQSESPVTPFLMFTGQAEEAIKFYQAVFDDVEVVSMKKYKAGEQGEEGTVQLATITIEGQRVKLIDSPPVHDFTFTPSFSFFVDCESEEQLGERFKILSEEGKVMMPLNNYGFSKKFGWTSDKFGVSWQLNLP